MKKNSIKPLLIVFTFLLVANINAQEIVTANGDTIARIDEAGIVTDAMHQQIGEIAGNAVKNSKGEVVGNLVGYRFYDVSGNLLGERKVVKGVHQLVMAGDFVLCTIEAGSQLVQTGGKVLIRSSGTVTQKQLIAYFFYF
jgi:hypothetical protein